MEATTETAAAIEVICENAAAMLEDEMESLSLKRRKNAFSYDLTNYFDDK